MRVARRALQRGGVMVLAIVPLLLMACTFFFVLHGFEVQIVQGTIQTVSA